MITWRSRFGTFAFEDIDAMLTIRSIADLKALLESYTDPGDSVQGASDVGKSEAANGVATNTSSAA